MEDRTHESGKNSTYKRGIIKEVAAAKGRTRVEFSDEDGNISFWLNVNQQGTGTNKSYAMPDVDSQVNCLIDWDGEDGTVLGAAWSEEDKPPTEDGDTTHVKTEAGTEIIINRKTGDMTITGAANVVFEAGNITIRGDVAIEGSTLTHNGKSISDTHKHTGVTPGGGISDVPE